MGKRYGVLDGIRGWTLLNMILYHAVWDLVYLFGVNWPWFNGPLVFWWQQSICWTFIFLSGFCVSMGRRKMRRGVQVLVASGLVSAVTLLAVPEAPILFGVLTLLGACMLLTAWAQPLLDRIPAGAGLPASLTLFFLTRNVNIGTLGFGPWNLLALPQGLYRNLFTAFLGFPTEEFYSTDYFSLFPWCFLFLAGLFAFRLCREGRALSHLAARPPEPLGTLGRYSLPLYLAHQPVLYGCLWLFF